jgi:hypothetical protein
MATLFDKEHGTRIVPIWLAAARHLLQCSGQQDYNLLLEIADPMGITDEDRPRLVSVNQALRQGTKCALTLDTVASTIFPLRMYQRHGRPEMYKRILTTLDRGGKPNSWGTYAERMISRPAKDGMNTINPLELIIEKLRASASGPVGYRSAFELNVADPEVDIPPIMDFDDSVDLPTYNATFDAKRYRNGPCLSNVSFKLVDKKVINLTAVYRAHHYCARGLGNLIGLARLLKFVASETGLQTGTLTCLSTYAELDAGAWGGLAKARKILA